jgi:peptide/nickel transport system permease protein
MRTMGLETAHARPPQAALYWQRLKRNPLTIVGAAVFLFFLAMAAVGPWLAPYGHQEQNIAQRLRPPAADHLFGTDQYGRDIFSRVLVGSRGIFLLGGTGTLLAALIGTTIGSRVTSCPCCWPWFCWPPPGRRWPTSWPW